MTRTGPLHPYHANCLGALGQCDYLPPTEVYMAFAEALHDCSDMCEEQVAFEDCIAREADIEQAIQMLRDLRADGWYLARDGQGTVPMWPGEKIGRELRRLATT